MDEHIIEALGRAKIIIKDGRIVSLGEPMIKYCPLFHKYRGIKELNKETIRENIEFRIRDFGMCTPERELKMKDFLSFGVSEIISTLLEENIIDCAVMVCEGAGTVLITEPEFAQGVGGRISGVVKTSPIKKIIEELGEENVLEPETGKIDQPMGVKKALDQGYNSIAVTVANIEDAVKIRKMDKKVYIFAVHLTGITRKEAEILFQNADIITSCASKHIRHIGDKKALFKAGYSIPIYAATKDGERFIKKRIEKIGGLKEKKNPPIPYPLI
ncbi:MAG: DUF2099 family protein [Methanobacteriales archaeon]|nr:DUF2099 family protein [Methanobacteriales archaeon]